MNDSTKLGNVVRAIDPSQRAALGRLRVLELPISLSKTSRSLWTAEYLPFAYARVRAISGRPRTTASRLT
jgi:hypothetical protein